MVDYSKFMNSARDRYLPKVTFNVQLPPVKEDCTCIAGSDSVLSVLNSPLAYCSDCDNRGYLETKVEHEVCGTMVDYASDSLQQKNALTEDSAAMFGRQTYVLHVYNKDCVTPYYNYENCFDKAKHVIIDSKTYKIQSVNKSILLEQVRVVVSLKN